MENDLQNTSSVTRPDGSQLPPRRRTRLDRVLLVCMLLMQCAVLAAIYVTRRPAHTQREPVPITRGDEDDQERLPPSEAHMPDDTALANRHAQDAMTRNMLALLGSKHDPFGSDFLNREAHAAFLTPQRSLRHEMNRMMQQAWDDLHEIDDLLEFDKGWNALMYAPTLDMRDEGDHYLVLFELPGLDDAKINVTLEGRLLTVSNDSSEQARHTPTVLRFERRVMLPGPIAADKEARAFITNHCLRVVVPKADTMSGPIVAQRLM